MKLLVLSALVAVALSFPADQKPAEYKENVVFLSKEDEKKEAPAIVLSDKAQYSYAFDVAAQLTTNTFSCFRSNGYAVAFVRVYAPQNGGVVDNNGCINVQNAYNANLGVEVYVTPQPSGSKQGYQQFDEAFTALKNAGITVRAIWLQVTSPVNWPNSASTNTNFISSFVNRAAQNGVQPGIYTNTYDWNQITSNWASLTNVNLWYWNVLGQGVSGESPANFDDFRSFGPWSSPAVKQFGQTETVCQTTINRDVYLTGSRSNLAKKAEGVVVGGFIHL